MHWVALNWLTDPAALRALGPARLAPILALLAPVLQAHNLPPPAPRVSDQYFNELAQFFQSLPLALAVYLPPFIQTSQPRPDSMLRQSQTNAARYSIRKDCGVWHLVLDSREALIKHQRAMFFVAFLLTHPSHHPIHALDLMARIPEIYRQQLGLSHFTDPATGKTVALPSDARLQERSLALDDAKALRDLSRSEKELEAILDDDSESEPVKAEALCELEVVTLLKTHHARRSRDSAQRAVDTVRKSIRRLHRHIHSALDPYGKPHPVLRPFADHLQQHLLTPSASLAGCFTYNPPPGISWLPDIPPASR